MFESKTVKNLEFSKYHKRKSQFKLPNYSINDVKCELNKENYDLCCFGEDLKRKKSFGNIEKNSKEGLSDGNKILIKRPCEKSIDENIIDIRFKNRNLCEVLRIRETEICKKSNENARNLIETIKTEKKNIKALYVRLNSLEARKEELNNSEIGILMFKNKQIEQNIIEINSLIKEITEKNITFENFLKVKKTIFRLDERIGLQFAKLISNEKEIKELTKFNSTSPEFTENIQKLSDINMKIYQFSLFAQKKFGFRIHEKFDNIEVRETCDRKNIQSFFNQIYNKLFNLRTKIIEIIS